MTRQVLVGAIALGAWIAAAPAGAGTVEVPVDAAREIVRGDGQSRVVLKVSDLSFLRDQLIRWATLEIPTPSLTVDRKLELYLYAAGSSWDPSTVSWTTPWRRPGGDWSEDAFGHARIEAGRESRSLRFDVSGILREIAEGREPNTGFVLLPRGAAGDGRFEGEERLLLSALSQATLTVSSRPFPKRARR